MFNCPHDQEIVHSVTNIPLNNVEIHFLLTGFFTQGCHLAAFLISKQPPRSYSYTPGGLGLVGLCLWVFSLAPLHHPLQTVLSWANLFGSEKVTLENILVYYYTWKSKINHMRCLWNCQGEDGTTFLILSAFLLSPTSSPFLKLLNHLVEGCVCYSEKSPGPPNSSVRSLWISVLFFFFF